VTAGAAQQSLCQPFVSTKIAAYLAREATKIIYWKKSNKESIGVM